MKKKISINTLALGNLKQRKKQYAIMIVGIILAMFFSSGILFYLFSSQETMKEMRKNEIGNQHAILSVADSGEEVYRNAVSDGLFDAYGLAHLIGFAYTNEEEENFGCEIAWLDDKAKEISYQSFIEGEYPRTDGEIAVEKNALIKLGYADAKTGDTIRLFVKNQNGSSLMESTEKEYVLSGIVTDKRCNLNFRGESPDADTFIPAAYVAENTIPTAGGREKLCAYISYKDFEYEKLARLDRYFKGKQLQIEMNDMNVARYSFIPLDSDKSFFAVLLALALMLSSCVVIVNSFNTNLKERKKQIGMLRAVGATKNQIVNIFAREALIIALICTPVSIALSYGAVYFAMKILKLDMVMTKSFWVLPISSVAGVCVVMLAALIPLVSASRITPMQAIRDISSVRKMKLKGIKTKKEFNVSSLMAQRNLLFFKGGRIAVSIMLAVTVIISCIGFSALKEYSSYGYKRSYDYSIDSSAGFAWSMVNFNEASNGISEIDKKDMEMIPYISEVIGRKQVSTCLELDEYSDYYKSFLNSGDNVFEYVESDKETYDNFYEMYLSEFNDAYINLKNALGIEKELFSTKIISVDSFVIQSLMDEYGNGAINTGSLDSGESVILVAPKKAAAAVKFYGENGEGGHSRTTVMNDAVTDYRIICDGELNYKAGDAITLDTIVCDESAEWYTNGAGMQNNKKQVSIAAVVDPSDISDDSIIKDFLSYEDICILTTTQGMNSFYHNAKYEHIVLNCGTEITDEIDKQITESLKIYADKYESWANSTYAEAKNREQQQMLVTISIVSLMTIIFAICGSIVNNSLTARIRENKKALGTLRAFGADRSELVKSYIKQLVSMFSWGMMSGFAVYIVMYIYNSPLQKKYITDKEFFMNFNPWVTIVFCIILFTVCSINLWLKIRAEMKHSIIDNIREL